MKKMKYIIFVMISSFVFSSFVNAEEQNSEIVGSEQIGRSSAILNKYVELNNLSANPADVYELRCRGGHGFSFTTVGSRTHSSGAVMVTLELGFSPALQAAGANSGGLQPGHCALVTRPFYLDEIGQIREPLKVRFETPANSQLKQAQQGSQIDRSPTAAESYPDAITIPNYLTKPSQYWSFQVSNSGKGYFEAQSHWPWKKKLDDRRVPGRDILGRPF